MPESTEPTPSRTAAPVVHRGGCHCGAIRFEVELAAGFHGIRCNCTICAKTAATGAIVKPNAFRLLQGEADRSGYVWGGKISTRYFCKHCGVHCYAAGYLEEVGGDFVSVNVNTLDDLDVNELEIVHFDGRHDNWMDGTRKTPWPVHARPS